MRCRRVGADRPGGDVVCVGEAVLVVGRWRALYGGTHQVLEVVQSWLSGRAGRACWWCATRGAVGLPGEDVTDLAGGGGVGVGAFRSDREPRPDCAGRFRWAVDVAAVDGALGSLSWWFGPGLVYAARLAAVRRGAVLELPVGESAWRLGVGGGARWRIWCWSLSATVRCRWRPGRCGWRWARSGVNFRDVLVALGMYPAWAVLGVEGAGVVLEVAPGVTGVAVGDQVMGLFPAAGSWWWLMRGWWSGCLRGGRWCRPPVFRWCF